MTVNQLESVEVSYFRSLINGSDKFLIAVNFYKMPILLFICLKDSDQS